MLSFIWIIGFIITTISIYDRGYRRYQICRFGHRPSNVNEQMTLDAYRKLSDGLSENSIKCVWLFGLIFGLVICAFLWPVILGVKVWKAL